jgi:hypothetical protein
MILICIFLAASAGFVFGWAIGSRMARANREADWNYEHRGTFDSDWAEAPGDPISPWCPATKRLPG